MSTKFTKETRYYVFKIKDLMAGASTQTEVDEIEKALSMLNAIAQHGRDKRDRQPLECVCVESNWRCYDEVWGLVEREWRDSQ